MAPMTRSRKAPGTVLANGRPAESSTRMPQASSRTATRRASRRSGETSAAVRPGVSAASRKMSATTSASSCAEGASMRLMPASAARTPSRSAVFVYSCQRPVVPDGRIASAMSAARSPARARLGAREHAHVACARGRAGRAASSSRTAGARDGRGDLCPALLVEMRIEPRQHDRALGSRATARISSTVAGIEPVTPATITGPPAARRRGAPPRRGSRDCAARPATAGPSLQGALATPR